MRELEYPSYPTSTGPRLRWSEIFAGSAVTLALLAAFNALGIGLGLQPSDVDFAIAPKAWWAPACGVVAFFVGGWCASRLSDSGGRSDGVLYGVICWAAATVLSVLWPFDALGGLQDLGLSGIVVCAMILLEAAAAGLGGILGARLYLPVPVSEYHRTRRHPAALRS
ncbi:MAG: hypothetical protein HY553_10150 [Elusimicrobia bacterium]|nr:hypothetical protein [Elusimicrobiota bacterium]